jgi:hypothetical protein
MKGAVILIYSGRKTGKKLHFSIKNLGGALKSSALFYIEEHINCQLSILNCQLIFTAPN